VIKTIFYDINSAFSTGMLFGLMAVRRGEIDIAPHKRLHFKVGALFWLIFGVGAGISGYIEAPDWMLMYFSDPKYLPAGMLVYIFSFYVTIFILGLFVGHWLESIKKGLGVYVFVAAVIYYLGTIALTFNRVWFVGTFEEFHAGKATPINETDIYYALWFALPLALACLIGVLIWLGRRKPQTAA
jgi:fucose permease